MMGKTHISVGIAAALFVSQPASSAACLATVLAGALGSITPDIDVHNSRSRDALIARLIVVGLAIVSFGIDRALGAQLWAYISQIQLSQQAIGLLGFFGLCAIGRFTPHRSFTHSVLALVLFSLALGLVLPMAIPAFAAGYASHLLLDLLNKMPMNLLFPLESGWCLHLCHADGLTNKVLMVAGLVGDIVLLTLCIEKFI
ncbi:metal-dependent hydrolase [Atopobium sp. oral taxon 810]|uniref:metal-dependent hydrolase n=1 Tax=Atopobium sp. oral taxon 810 TaxID=712158 RepID=UPI000396702F|nr:metal-dependent hydrolase [Atopobium sp. oral taxon 810]ERI05251.1 putative membrane-bound metal-dependent hydrolase [Atopobium sp. oral taxon 810 str. F0209]